VAPARPIVIVRRTRIYWLCQIAGWVTYEAAWLVPQLAMPDPGPLSMGRLAIGAMEAALLAIVASHLYRHVIRRRAWAALSPPRLLLCACAGSLVVGCGEALAWVPLSRMVQTSSVPVRSWLPWNIATSTFSVLLWSTVYFGVHYFESWRQAERHRLELAVAATRAELDSLRAQLNPHFLFNCLNSVRALTIEDPPKAHAAVTALSTLIRYALEATQVATVPLGAELDMIRAYLVLEGIRFEERLRYELAIEPATRHVAVPPMLVQSLVENGVKHGIERLRDGGTITVAAWLDGDGLRVRVTNTGRIVAHGDSPMLGLRNARERLRLLYGASASLAMRDDAGSVVAELAVPVVRTAA
jgi:hypothetical protein